MDKNKYVEIDEATGQISIVLPQDLEIYFNNLKQELMDEYAFDGLNKNNIEKINDFIINWFKEKNISIPD